MKRLSLIMAVAALACAAGAAPSASQPIGVFDSGIGGMTVLERLLAADAFDNLTGEQIPDGKPDFSAESFVYFGDQANMPYGMYDAEGKADFLRGLVVRDARFVLGNEGHEPAKIVVIACNTATAYGLGEATEAAKPHGVKVIGVVNAGVAAAMDDLNVKKGMPPFAIAVMATPGTIASGAYQRTLRSAFAQRGIEGYEIVARGGVGLAEAVENGDPLANECARTNFTAMVRDYRARGGKLPIRAVILGCTHYPFVLDTFKGALAELRADPACAALLADDFTFVDPAVYTAVQCFRSLRADGLLNTGKKPPEKRVKPFVSVGVNGPLSHAEKYGRNVGQEDVGTKIVPMGAGSVPDEALRRLRALLPVTAKELFTDE